MRIGLVFAALTLISGVEAIGNNLGSTDLIFANGFDGTGFPPGCPADDDGDGLLDLNCVAEFTPPDPVTVAPPINPTIPTSFPDAIRFIYSDPNPIQQGMTESVIREHRTAVLKGTVKDTDGEPLPGVLIRVLDHPEFGYTYSRADGAYDLVVNGGGELTLDYQKTGFLRSQRVETTPWWQWQYYENVVMVALDTAATVVPLGPSMSGSVHVGSPMSDADGNRRATVYFPPGTQAQLVLWDGSQTPLSSINVRATEYTVGPLGRERMPGPLPETSNYTYAVELSADEAIAANARKVEFSQPVVLLVENFLDYPVGEGVPLGHYDFRAGTWLPSDDGTIVKVIMISGGLAILDVDGSGQPASNAALIALGITDAEREQIALSYSAGTELWRSRINHFTPWDCNWGGLPPGDAEPPPAPEPPEDQDDPCPPGGPCPDGNDDDPDANAEDEKEDDPCQNIQTGSVIECESQTLKEYLPVKGTPFSLVYSSNRVPDAQGRLIHSGFRFRVPVTGPQVPPSLVEVQVQVDIGGRRRTEFFTSVAPNFVYEGFVPYADVYGRGVPGEGVTGIQGTAAYCVAVRFYYPAVPAATVPGFLNFALPSGVEMGPDRGRGRIYYERRTCSESRGRVTRYSPPSPNLWDARGVGNGGWTLDIHHAYDPTSNKLIYGSGRTRELGYAEPLRLDVVRSVNADVYLEPSADLAVSADGSVMTIVQVPKSPNWNLVRVDPVSGVSVTVAETCVPMGGPEDCEGAPLIGNFSSFTPLEGGSIAAAIDRKIYLLGSSGSITTIFDGSTHSPQCTPKHLTNWRGSIYFACANEGWIGRLWPGGAVTRFAGPGTNPADGAAALQADIGEVVDLATDPTGEVFFANPTRVRKITRGGNVETVAGGMTAGDSDDQVLARGALLGTISSIAIANDQFLYIVEASRGGRIREVRDTGYLYTTVGGGDASLPTGTEIARRLSLSGASSNRIAIAPDGTLFLKADGLLFKQVRSSFMAQGENSRIRIASENGLDIFVFNRDGRHLETRFALTDALKYQFGYNGAGYLVSIVDGDGNATALQRDTGNQLTSIVGPDGLTTTASIDERGWLLNLSDPLEHAWEMTYSDGGHLRSITDPRLYASTFGYDVKGGLAFDENAEDGRWDLTRYEYASSQAGTVEMMTAEGRRFTYSSNRGPSGSFAKISLTPDGRTTRYSDANGVLTEDIPYLRTRVVTQESPDPRFQMDSPYTGTRTVEIKDSADNTLSRQTVASIESFKSGGQAPFDLRQNVQVNGRNRIRLFSASDRSWLTISPAGRRSNKTLDERTRPTKLTVDGVEPIDIAYDPRGRLASIAQGQGAAMRVSDLTYAANGTLASITDAESRTMGFDIDNGGRIDLIRLPDAREVLFTHNDSDQITSITPPDRPAHTFDYDKIGRLTAYRPPTLGTGDYSTRYTYDLDSRLTRIDRPDGRSAVFNYEGALTLGRLSSIVIDEGQYSISYRPGTTQSPWNAQIAQIVAPGNVTLELDWFGHKPQRVSLSGAVSGEVTFAYDNNFWLGTLTIAGHSVSYGHDPDGLLTSAGPLSLSRSTANTQLLTTTLGVVSDEWTYSPFGEPDSYEARVNGLMFYRTEYTRDKLSRIIEKRETASGMTTIYQYDYDLAGRLKQVRSDGQVLSDYAFDGNSNRTLWTRPAGAQADDCVSAGSVGASYDDQDRMVTYGRCSFDYSTAGDLLRKTRNDTGAFTDYKYDDFGNLRRVILPNGDTIDYVIDGLNRRVGKRINGSLVQGFLYMNQLEPVAELNGNGQVMARFIYADRSHVPAYIVKDSVTYRVIADHLGSVRWVINTSTGDVAQAIDYDEFGRILNDSNPGFQPFGYAGGIIDHDTGLGRFGARDYDPRSGTFSTKDQLIFKSASPNPYIYCRANPINCIDVSGLADINYAACSTADIEASASINDPGALDVTSHSYYVDENNLEHGDYRPNRPSCRLDEYGDRQNPAVTPDDMVADIKGHKEFPSSTHINLFLCGAANGDDPLGQYVADQTGLPVLASYGPARATPNGPSGFNLQFWFIPN